MSNTIIDIKNSGGVILDTYHMYCDGNIQVKPVLQSKSVTENGSVVADEGYCGLDSVTVDVPATPTEEQTVDLAMASGNQTITPTSGKVLSQVVVKKPATMLPENIKKNVNIGGVTGTLESQTAPTLQTKTVTPTKSQQSVSPDSGYDGLSSVTVNAIPDNYQPTLNAPTIAINDKTLTITNPASNGNFVTKFKVFSNGTALTEAVIKGGTTTVDLSTLLTTAGTYSITAKASAANFNDSAASSAVTTFVADPIFENNSWATIAKVFKSGTANKIWNVGDTKKITAFGRVQYTIRIVDMQSGRYDYADGSGSSKGVFEFVECVDRLDQTAFSMNSTRTNAGGFASSRLRNTTLPNILADLPDDMQAAISEVNVLSGTGSETTSGTSSSANKLFLPAEMEMFDAKHYSIGLEECPLGQFDYYKAHNTNADRKKTRGSTNTYWLRSSYANSSATFCSINNIGSQDGTLADDEIGVAPIFAI